jgi:hypothetical protein
MKRYSPIGILLVILGTLIACSNPSSPATTYKVTYDANGATGGSVPVDTASYTSGQQATILGNTGNLANPYHLFAGWNLKTDGSGTSFAAGALLTMSADITLYSQWPENLAALGTGVDSNVRALACDPSDNLYAGGLFTAAGGISAKGIAKWNGSDWAALGTGVDNFVYALTCDSSGNLYVGGSFTTAGGIPANGIARWDGTAWAALGTGVDYYVYALAHDSSGNIYAGGMFTTVSGTSAKNVAKWNGSNWASLGNGLNGTVYALACDSSGNVYAGGSFTFSGSTTVSRIAKWNGSNWSALETGVNNTVSALACDSSGNLYAGGDFNVAGKVTANYVAKWDGSSWTALDSGMSYPVSSLLCDSSNNVYIGIGGYTDPLTQWNGSTMKKINTRIDVEALTFNSSGDIYCGGNTGFFTSGMGLSRVAKLIR